MQLSQPKKIALLIVVAVLIAAVFALKILTETNDSPAELVSGGDAPMGETMQAEQNDGLDVSAFDLAALTNSGKP
jgi:hypothetical protein